MDSLKKVKLKKKNKYFLLFVLLICVGLQSCGDSIKDSLEKELKDVDMVKIYFYESNTNKPGRDKIATIQDKIVIGVIRSSILDESTEMLKCGYTGSMEFFKKNISVNNMEFSTEPGCERVVFRLKDNMYSKKLSPEGIKLINDIYSRVDMQNKADLINK